MGSTTIIGMVIGFVCVIVGILISGDIMNFWDAPSVFIVFGGVIGATIACYPLAKIKLIPKLFKMAIGKDKINIKDDIDLMVNMANVARKEGLLSLENMMERIESPFIKNGIMLILDGYDHVLVKDMLETEVTFMTDRHMANVEMFESMSAFSPAFGMAGTLIGLINMLVTLSDADSIGPQMSVALVTTFYGVVLANLVFTPIARQLRALDEHELLQRNIIIEGILSIQDGENPRVIREKLISFVSHEEAMTMRENESDADDGK